MKNSTDNSFLELAWKPPTTLKYKIDSSRGGIESTLAILFLRELIYKQNNHTSEKLQSGVGTHRRF